MHHWSDIRRRARARHREVLAATGGDNSAAALLTEAAKATGFKPFGVEADNPLLDGGEAKLDRENGVVWFNADAPLEQQRFYQAHEFAHAWLDTGGYGCLAGEIDEAASADPGQVGGADRVEGYSPRERDEREANVFAREFLLPSDTLREWAREGLSASDIADRIGVSLPMVLHQLGRALLVAERLDEPEEPSALGSDEASTGGLALDDHQGDAAEADGPVLVVAGPGTGKTRALTARVVRLVNEGVSPDRILALTFSNRAAEEMRERVGRSLPDAAHRLWLGTFHAFGLELLLKHNERVGLSLQPTLLDPTDAAALLETAIADLDLHHYRHLPDPGLYLPNILGAISRAKDEVVGPDGYAELADRMAEEASTDDDVLRAEKAQEVARVYAVYQNLLGQNDALDFGDLIYRTVLLLEDDANEDLRRDLQGQYPHVLVDEYQDVNRASGRLLQAIAGGGSGLWVVGDPRQAIYRWRGASTQNLTGFGTDYPGATTKALGVNYRSRPRIVDTVAELAPAMKASPPDPFEPWEAHRRDEPGVVSMDVATTMEAEALGLARRIAERQAAGVAYRDQAVLCRSHTLLDRFARLLEAQEVPVLYLGEVFERPEVRDLLALVSLTCEGGWNGLVRVARFPEYAIPDADVASVLAWAREGTRYPLSSLPEAADLPGMSTAGSEGLRLLHSHLNGVHPNTPTWDLLAGYLFESSEYLARLAAPTEVQLQQRRLALYQLLSLAHDHRGREAPGSTTGPVRRLFLRYVRRLTKLGQDRQIRQVPEWADDIDAVRLLTVHASKGLEFDTVYLPALATTYFPASNRHDPCPPPKGLVEADAEDVREEEEECLFFVALSRARDHLALSRAKRYGSVNRSSSSLLPLIEAHLPTPFDGEPTLTDEPAGAASPVQLQTPAWVSGPFTSTSLDTYLVCPRRFFYDHVLDLNAWTDPSPYLAFHTAVRRTLRDVVQARIDGDDLDPTAVHRDLADACRDGPVAASPYADLLREEAARLTDAVLKMPSDRFEAATLRPEWTVSLSNGDVTVRPDVVRRESGTPIVERWKTGRLSSKEADKYVYALLHEAASSQLGNYEMRALALASDEEVPLPMTPAKRTNRLWKYDDAMAAIAAGDFPPKPNDRECPGCPFYFVCPA